MSVPVTWWRSSLSSVLHKQHSLEGVPILLGQQRRRCRRRALFGWLRQQLRSRPLSLSRDSALSITAAPSIPGLSTPLHDQSLTVIHGLGPINGASPEVNSSMISTATRADLPLSCPGCGGLTQNVNLHEAGYYTRNRKSIKNYLRALRQNGRIEAVIPQQDLADDDEALHVVAADDQRGEEQDAVPDESTPAIPADLRTPVCDRCHNLLHSSKGVPIAHPSIDAIADSIAESPHRRNHIYHVLDAADFPMSLIASIHKRLFLARPRSKNRRSQHDFSRKPTMDFIITRSDLLAPSKDMVDSLMNYFTAVLREALGRSGRDMRLGNVHLVSAKRGWWTKEIKEAIWQRGGGNWMVGKVNVGKSNLFEVLFPKGSGERTPPYTELSRAADHDQRPPSDDVSLLEESSLLPPAQPLRPYPTLPIISPLPGTTASPIRLPFGSPNDIKGELIDTPGLSRGPDTLTSATTLTSHSALLMETRPNVAQHIIKPGQSLILGGGLIRITPHLDPADKSITMLAYPFLPPALSAHVTSTDKAIASQGQSRESRIKSILAHGADATIRKAGTFKLSTDVTKPRARSVLAAGQALANLPFRVYATDVLIEGVGWVELVCQVRKRKEGKPTPAPEHVANNDSRLPAPPEAAAGLASDPIPEPELRSESIPPKSPPNTLAFNPFNNVPTSKTAPPSSSSSSLASPPSPPHSPSPPSIYPSVSIFSPYGQSIATRRCMSAWTLWDDARRARMRRRTGSVTPVRPRRPMKGFKKRERAERRRREGGGEAEE